MEEESASAFVMILKMLIITKEMVIDKKIYHTVYEAKNGLGPAPIKTELGGFIWPMV